MNNSRETVIITIDGPAGAGKSTIAKGLAKKLTFAYLDTGAMYRALTLKALRNKTNLDSESDLVALAEKTSIDFEENSKDGLKVTLDGEDVSEAIRTSEVTNNTFYIARAPQVRAIMVQWQRSIGQRKNVVVEGRDVGTVVFPQATNKFYLDADFDARTQRRIKELREKGKQVDDEQLKEDLHTRDTSDFTRKVGPLKKAEDAVVIDSTHLSIEEVVETIKKHINLDG